MMISIEALQYPIGRFHWPGRATPGERSAWIQTIAATPSKLEQAVAGLTPEQLEVRYRDGGWTVRQVVHHYADVTLDPDDVVAVGAKPYILARGAEVLTGGYIALQSEGHPVEFKDIEIQELTAR